MAVNVVIVIDTLQGGGAERVALAQATAFRRSGFGVTIVVRKAAVDYSVPEGVELVELEKTDRLAHLRRLIAARGPVRCVLSHLPEADKLVASLGRRDAVFFMHNTMSRHWIRDRQGIRRWNTIRRLRRIYRGTKIACVSEGVARDFEELGVGPARLAVIYNPFDSVEIQHLSLEYSPPLPSGYVLQVGRLEPPKRPDLLLRAYAESGIAAPVVLLGKGPMAGSLSALADSLGIFDRVVFPGFCANPYPWMRNAGCICLASDYEGFGNVLVEGLICGRPAVALDCPSGPSEILTGDLSQFLVPPGDIGALSRALREAVSSSLRVERRHYERFDLQRVVPEILAFADA